MSSPRYISSAPIRRLAEKIFGAVIVGVLMFTLNSKAFSQSAKPSPSPSPDPHPEVKRWFDLEALTVSARYRYIQNRNGTTAANQLQYQFVGRGIFKFDRKGRYSIHAGLFTGDTITGGWNTTGWGTGNLQTNLYLKQLYFDARPVRSLEIQYGGIGVNNGENTEITGYDNDVYITGERVQLRRPKQLYFDEISVTYAYLGDNTRPSVFRRFKHLDRSNYHQFLVRKQVNKRVGFSADYTFESGIDTLRQAVKLKLPESRIADSFLFENYERVDETHGYGFGLTGEKKIGKDLTLTGGVTKISHRMLNGDRYPPGTRLYLLAAYKFSPEFTLTCGIFQGVGPLATPTTPRTRLDIIATYNILSLLHRTKLY